MLPNLCDIKPNKISSNLKGKIFWFHGEPGTWKTTVASKFPKAFIAGFEIGYQFIDGVYALPMGGWSDMKDLYRQLKMPQVKEKFDTIVFDTISNAASMCYKYALGQLGVSDPSEAAWGQGWRKIKDEWKIIQEIVKLGYCIVFISHSKETEVTDTKTKTSTIKVKTDLEGWSSDSIWGLSDFVFYVRKEMEEDGTEKVYAYSDLPNVDTTSNLTTLPFSHAALTVWPPRALKPLNSPDFQAFGSAGRILITVFPSTTSWLWRSISAMPAAAPQLPSI